MDVRTKCFRVIDLEPFGLGSLSTKMCANSKYLAFMDEGEISTKVGIFDLQVSDETTNHYIPCHFTVSVLTYNALYNSFVTSSFRAMQFTRFLLRSNGLEWMKLNFFA
jgi:hypothetical protein